MRAGCVCTCSRCRPAVWWSWCGWLFSSLPTVGLRFLCPYFYSNRRLINDLKPRRRRRCRRHRRRYLPSAGCLPGPTALQDNMGPNSHVNAVVTWLQASPSRLSSLQQVTDKSRVFSVIWVSRSRSVSCDRAGHKTNEQSYVDRSPPNARRAPSCRCPCPVPRYPLHRASTCSASASCSPPLLARTLHVFVRWCAAGLIQHSRCSSR